MLAAILIILVGVGFMCYPKLTDFWYQFTQWRLAAQASGLTALVGDRTEDSEILGTGGGHTGVPLPGGTVALLEIPAIGFRAYVVEGTGRAALAQGPGHYPGTPLPGEPGNAAIAGHRTMYGHPFGDLDRLQPGDQILTATAQRRAAYRVVEILIVDPTHTEVAADAGDNRLTLTTCHPKGSAAKRLVVVAELTD
jgi:sortase A